MQYPDGRIVYLDEEPTTTSVITSQHIFSASPVAVFAKTLKRGSRHPDVKRLQVLLNSDPSTRVAETGMGSSGNETEYFGPATARAVKKFQTKYQIATPGVSGYGLVGPKTRAKLAELFGN
jgi:peptidoglycan hydrolase-like protein with peptidoglycan-binding domain